MGSDLIWRSWLGIGVHGIMYYTCEPIVLAMVVQSKTGRIFDAGDMRVRG